MISMSESTGCFYNALTLEFDICLLGFVGVAVILDCKILDVHHDLGHILFYSGDGRELMKYTFDFNLAYCCTG